MIEKNTSNIYPKIGFENDTTLKDDALLFILPPHTCDETACYVYPKEFGENTEHILNEFKDYLDDCDNSKLYIIVAAIGAGDYYGPNANADYVSEEELLKNNAYKTFESAKVFVEHDNKDPRKAVGRVLKAVYDNKMHRVLLLLEIDPIKAPKEAVDDLIAGKSVGLSMGLYPAFDVCSVCGNLAASATEYCKHLSPTFICRICHGVALKPEQMCEHMKADKTNVIKVQNNILKYDQETGNLIYMINYGVKFHDISLVGNPAEKDSWALYRLKDGRAEMLKYEFNKDHRSKYKSPEVRSGVEMNKIACACECDNEHINLNGIKLLLMSEPDIPLEILQFIKKFDSKCILPTMSAMAIIIRPNEYNYLKPTIPDGDYRKFYNPLLAQILLPFIFSRSLYKEFLENRIKIILINDVFSGKPMGIPEDEKDYDKIVEYQSKILSEIENSQKTAASSLLNDLMEKKSGILKWSLVGALAPSIYAGYKTTTAKGPEDIDWVTRKVYENPLGAALTGAALFGAGRIGVHLLGRKLKIPSLQLVAKKASEDIDGYINIPISPINIDTNNYLELLNKKASTVLEELNRYLQKIDSSNTILSIKGEKCI